MEPLPYVNHAEWGHTGSYLLLYVLQQEGGGSQIVHGNVKEALDLFLMEVHGDQVGETCANVVRTSNSQKQQQQQLT